MNLAALIIADHEGVAGKSHAKEALIFGMPLVEYQARQAAEVGATHIIICTMEVPAALVSAIDRLNLEVSNIMLVRTAREAADLVHPEEAVLLFGSGCLADLGLVKQLAEASKNVIVVSPLKALAPSRELIDAEHDWAGLARIDGKLVRHTATLPGDWALGSILLRMAVQAGATRILTQVGNDVHHINGPLDARIAVQSLVSHAENRTGKSQIGRITGFLGQELAKLLSGSGLRPQLFLLMPLLLLAIVSGSALLGSLPAALSLFIFAEAPGRAANALAKAALLRSKWLDYFWRALPWVGRGMLLVAAYEMWKAGTGWGVMTLASWLVWNLWFDGKDPEKTSWSANEASVALFMLFGIMAGLPVWGAGAALAHTLLPHVLRTLRHRV